MKDAIICDIDNCLLDSRILFELNKKNRKDLTDWDTFYANLHLCSKNTWCYQLLEAMVTAYTCNIIFITGRDEKVREITESFLTFSVPISYQLLMRPKGNLDTDMIVKFNLLTQVKDKYNILFALDDKQENCDMYSRLNIPVLKVILPKHSWFKGYIGLRS